ncbi:MAG: helix-hairpin-helix domain-containing protein [Chloroflexi bacterium]|nr:helix-hairpin-helix domain-containing protein [Chloroflexota bacterium]
MTGFRDKMWLIIAVFLAVSLITGGVLLSIRLAQLQPVEIALEDTATAKIQGEVYISGAVARPGIYSTKAGDSLTSLVSAAGLSDNADTEHVKLYVPCKGEIKQPQKVDLNTAGAWLLQALPGIGEGKAKMIVAFREKNGPLRSVDDLLKIEGFGASILDKIRGLVTIGD